MENKYCTFGRSHIYIMNSGYYFILTERQICTSEISNRQFYYGPSEPRKVNFIVFSNDILRTMVRTFWTFRKVLLNAQT